jgi:hypothetical protein
MTGCAEHPMEGHSLLDSGMKVITHPFQLAALAGGVRQMIER